MSPSEHYKREPKSKNITRTHNTNETEHSSSFKVLIEPTTFKPFSEPP